MKRIYDFLPLLLCIFLLSACEEDEDKADERRNLVITETTGQGEEEVTTVQQFDYLNGRLTQHVTTQTFTDRWLEAKYTLTVTNRLSYEPGRVISTDEAGNISTYFLNEEGYATSCTREEPGGNVRTYQFSYSPELGGVLTGIRESIDGNTYSEIAITVSQENVMRITEKLNGIQNTFVTEVIAKAPGGPNTMSRLPWLFLVERYPLTLHEDALYAGILGDPLALLPGSVAIEGSDEVTTYTYVTDENGYITSCASRISMPGTSGWYRNVQYAYN